MPNLSDFTLVLAHRRLPQILATLVDRSWHVVSRAIARRTWRTGSTGTLIRTMRDLARKFAYCRSAGWQFALMRNRRNLTAGVVLRPRFIPGLNVAFDWYDIKLKGAVNYPTAQELFELCVDQPSLDNVFCGTVERDPDTGYADSFLLIPQNVASFRTAGLDMVLNYRFAPSNWVLQLPLCRRLFASPGFIPTVCAESTTTGRNLCSEVFGEWRPDMDQRSVTLNYGINCSPDSAVREGDDGRRSDSSKRSNFGTRSAGARYPGRDSVGERFNI